MFKFFIGRLIPGSVSVETRSPDDQSNSKTFITAPAHALYLTAGDIYAPLIIVNESGGSLYLQLGKNCIFSVNSLDRYHHCTSSSSCNIMNPNAIPCSHNEAANGTGIRTLSFNICIDDGFIDGQANMTVYFIHNVNQMEYNISGYLYFDSQPTAGGNSCTSTQPPPINNTPTQCDSPTTGNSDPTAQTTNTPHQEQVTMSSSASVLNHLDLPRSVFILTVSLLLSST